MPRCVDDGLYATAEVKKKQKGTASDCLVNVFGCWTLGRHVAELQVRVVSLSSLTSLSAPVTDALG